MSVRRSPARAARRGSNDALGVVKGTLIWGSLLAGSFLFGMLVISPIYYQWRGGPSASISTSPSPQSQPPAIQAPAAPGVRESERDKPRPARRVPEPEISVSAEPNRAEVQKPDSLDESKSAKRRAKEDLNGGITTDEPPAGQTATERRKTAPQEDVIQPEERVNPDSARSAESETPQPSESRRSRRARKSAESTKSEAATSKRRSRKPAADETGGETKTKDSGSKAGVQKGETID